jgi:hypothetical protein
MNMSVKKWRERVKYLIIFLMLVYLLFRVFQHVYTWIDPFGSDDDRPSGRAVKVFNQLHEGDGHVLFKDRLLFFYWYGE